MISEVTFGEANNQRGSLLGCQFNTAKYNSEDYRSYTMTRLSILMAAFLLASCAQETAKEVGDGQQAFLDSLSRTFVRDGAESDHCQFTARFDNFEKAQFFRTIANLGSLANIAMAKVDHQNHQFVEFAAPGACPSEDDTNWRAENKLSDSWARTTDDQQALEAILGQVTLSVEGIPKASVHISQLQDVNYDSAVRALSFGRFGETECHFTAPKHEKLDPGSDTGNYVPEMQLAAMAFAVPLYFIEYDAHEVSYQFYDSCNNMAEMIEYLEELVEYRS